MATYDIASYDQVENITAERIKNLALNTLGFTEEVDFDDLSNKTVELVNRVYNGSLMYALSSYPWRFIMKRVRLDEREEIPAGKYKYRYYLPYNLLAIRTVYGDAGYQRAVAEYDSHPEYIDTDSQDVWLWYSAVVDEELFPPYFVDYFKYKLALDMCFTLTGDTDLMQIIKAQHDQMLSSARNIDAKQNEVRRIRSSPFLAIRR
jgi:hypothetical protein